ncbi:MAG: hypothetical protein NUW00_01655 [Candidatus Kaiserbacteria bacterium]|nr:hypothetical protein [Candidatus Kaiserbacteria bacterium]
MPLFESNTENRILSPHIESCTDTLKTLSVDTQIIIDNTWKQIISENENLYSSSLFRYVRHTQNENSITLCAQNDIEYKDVVGLRNSPDFLKQIPTQDQFCALSLISLCYSADGFGILVERNSGDWPHSLELPGGFLRKSRGVDINEQRSQLLIGDLGTNLEKITSLNFAGFLLYPEICEMMMVYTIRLPLSFKDIQEQAPKKLHAFPPTYTTQAHDSTFNLPLHTPSKTVLDLLLH